MGSPASGKRALTPFHLTPFHLTRGYVSFDEIFTKTWFDSSMLSDVACMFQRTT